MYAFNTNRIQGVETQTILFKVLETKVKRLFQKKSKDLVCRSPDPPFIKKNIAYLIMNSSTYED